MTTTDVPEGLGGDDLETWVAFATVLEWLPLALDAPLVHRFDLTHFEYGILFALADATGRTLRMSVLANFANSSLSRLSRAVSRLEDRGWVRRSRDPDDGRAIRATLTEVGFGRYCEATPDHVESIAELILRPLTSTQKRQLREISIRIQRAIREGEGWQAPRAARSAAAPE